MQYKCQIVVFLLISSAHFHTQNNTVRLTWVYKKGYLQLECYVPFLAFPLNFVFQDVEKSHCTTPFPSQACYIYDKHGIIHQDLNTNITTYIIPTCDPESFNGRWSCVHGQHNSSTEVEIHIERIFTTAKCSSQAFQSVLAAFFVTFIVTMTVLQSSDILTYRKESTRTEQTRFCNWCSLANIAHMISCNWIVKDAVRQVVKIALCGLLAVWVICSPLISCSSNFPNEDHAGCIVLYVFFGMLPGSLFALCSGTSRGPGQSTDGGV